MRRSSHSISEVRKRVSKSKDERIRQLVVQNEELRQALKPFAAIGLERDIDLSMADMVSAPDLSISPTMVRAARAALRR